MANGGPDLSEIDKELLELAVLTVPWYMVCRDFHRRYGSPGALAKRLIELSEAGFVSIQPKRPGIIIKHHPGVSPQQQGITERSQSL